MCAISHVARGRLLPHQLSIITPFAPPTWWHACHAQAEARGVGGDFCGGRSYIQAGVGRSAPGCRGVEGRRRHRIYRHGLLPGHIGNGPSA